MLEALEQGVKGGVGFSLIDKVYASRTLAAAWRQVHARDGAGGVDRQTVAQFAARAEQHLSHLSAALRTGTYEPQPVRRCWIGKRGVWRSGRWASRRSKTAWCKRPCGWCWSPSSSGNSSRSVTGFVPGAGATTRCARSNALGCGGATWVVDADIKSYFDTIPHAQLMQEVRTRVADGRVLELLRPISHRG